MTTSPNDSSQQTTNAHETSSKEPANVPEHTEQINPETSSSPSDTTPANDPQEAKPPPFPEHLRREAEEFARKTAEFAKSLDPYLAPYRGLLEAMKQERRRYNAWLEAHPQRIDSFQDLESYAASQYMRGVEILSVPEMGRGIFATTTLKAGDLFLAEDPLVSAPNEDDPAILSTLGMFANPWTLAKELIQLDPERQALAAQLCNAHTDKVAYLQAQLAQIQSTSPQSFPQAESEALVRWLGIAQSNSFSFQFRQRKRTGMYLLASMLNHSCAPNATFSFEGTTIVIHAQTEFPAGTQLFSSYLGGRSLSVERRQQMLQERFHFTCRCPTCSNELSIA